MRVQVIVFHRQATARAGIVFKVMVIARGVRIGDGEQHVDQHAHTTYNVPLETVSRTMVTVTAVYSVELD
jgi:hypothetical protein